MARVEIYAEQGITPEPKQPRVLLVDPYLLSRSLCREILEEKEANVVEARSAEEAEELLTKDGFTHVITEGLTGDWRRVRQAAIKAGCENFVMATYSPEILDNPPDGVDVREKFYFFHEGLPEFLGENGRS